MSLLLSGWSAAAAAQLAGSTVRLAVVFRLASTPISRIWSGVGDLAVPADLVETTGGVYSGIGDLISIPTLQQLINGVAERVSFSLAGISAAALALGAEAAGVVAGAPVALGFMVLDEDWQALSPMAWIWEGVADVVTPARQTSSGDAVRTLTLSAGSVFTGRRRPSLGYWTDAQQRLRSPTDAFCDQVAGYSPGTTKRFKPRS